MRIRTQFIIMVLVFGIAVSAMAASAVVTGSQIRSAVAQEEIANRVAQGSVELSYLANDFVIYGESQQLARWNSRFATFSEDIASLDVSNAQQQRLVSNIQSNRQRLKEVFDSIAAGSAAALRDPGGAIDASFLQISWSRMAVQSQGLSTDASRLADLLREQMDRATMARTILIYGIVGLLALFMITVYLFVYRRILKSISTLQAGTRVIGSGNLDYAIVEKRNDELGDLSGAFNRMTSDLKKVTASKADLEREVEERKKAEEALRNSEQRLRRLFTSMTEGVCEHELVYDASGKPIDYAITGTNPAYGAITGMDCEKALHCRASEFYGLNPAPYLDIYAKVAETGEPYTFETYYPPLEKHFSISVFSPGRGKFVTVFSDISERKADEAEIEHLASFPRLNPSPVIELDMSGNVVYANPRATTVFPDLMSLGSEHPFFSGIVDIIRKGDAGSLTRDIRVGDLWYEQSLAYVEQSQNYRVYARDITERKAAEEAVRRYNAELEAANKELEAFSYSVSHDLRAPLRSMEGFSSALIEDYGDKLDEQGRKYLKYVQEASDLMGQLIDDLLKLSRVTRSEMNREAVDLSDLAQKVALDLERADPGRKVELSIAPQVKAYGDRNLLRLALENLIGNAWKFSSKTESPRIEIGVSNQGGKRAFFVRDNGAGFDMAYADKLFRPFQRLHKAAEFPGTGIGLATVQRIVHRHGGEVWAESKVGQGATFYFTVG